MICLWKLRGAVRRDGAPLFYSGTSAYPVLPMQMQNQSCKGEKHHEKELKEKKISLSDLLAYPILMLDKNSTTNEFLHRLFQQHQLDLVPEIELTSNDLLIDLARIGLGIAFIPDYCISKESDGIFTLDMNEEMPERSLVIAYNEQLPLSKATQEFLSCFHPVEE